CRRPDRPSGRGGVGDRIDGPRDCAPRRDRGGSHHRGRCDRALGDGAIRRTEAGRGREARRTRRLDELRSRRHRTSTVCQLTALTSVRRGEGMPTQPWVGRTRPLVIAHRGHSIEVPENTLEAYRRAIELGVEMIECDVNMSRDGELVMIHDWTLDRTTTASGRVED